MLTEIDHVAFAVKDIEATANFYLQAFGAEVTHREEVAHDGVAEAMIEVADSYIQLLQPTRPDSPVAKFIAKRGEGIHHVAYRVDDCAAAIEAMRRAGARPIDEVPRQGSRGTLVAFIHPASTNGVLIELVEVAQQLY